MAVLSTTIIESITINNNKTRLTNTKSITGINNIYNRVVALPASQTTTLAMFQTSEHTQDGALDLEDTKYIRITNTHATEQVTISLQVAGAEGGTANKSASILLDAGKSFMLGPMHDGISVDSTGATVITALTDLESIAAVCGSTSVTLELFIATA